MTEWIGTPEHLLIGGTGKGEHSHAYNLFVTFVLQVRFQLNVLLFFLQ